MALPTHVKYLIIGAGVHGLSTAYHLARELKARGQGQRRGHPGRRQDRRRRRRVGHRLRRGPQQLLPAGHARAHGPLRRGLGERSRGLQLPPRRLHADQPGSDARATSATIYEQQKEIGYPSEFIEGEADCLKYMKGLFTTGRPRASPRCCTRRRAATPTTRLRCYGLAAKAENEGVRIVPGSRSPASSAIHSSAVAAVVTDQGTIRTAITSSSASARGSSRSGTCSTCPRRSSIKGRDGKMHHDVRMWTYWCLAGRHARRRSRATEDQRRRNAAGDPRRHRRAAVFGRRRLADHRQALGHLLQARLLLRRRAGRRHALQDRDRPGRGQGRSLRPGSRPTSLSARISRRCGARRWPSARSGSRARYRIYKKEPSGGIGASRRTASRSSTCSARTATSSPTPTTATR